MSRIHITGLSQMPMHVRELGPTHLISVVQPEYQPQRPPEIPEERHLRIAVHDVSEDDGWSVVVGTPEIRRILEFAESWEPEGGDLLVHCLAGVSRSTATALIAHYLKTGNALASAIALRRSVPYAVPNRRIVELADDELELGGGLISARERMGPPTSPFYEERLATLEL
ncbi:MAG: hypothetical protein VYE73_14700 [Acidobacteriota bacterium]|nr:hypothetical protein [Acidobacteriota bacterium]